MNPATNEWNEMKWKEKDNQKDRDKTTIKEQESKWKEMK